MRFGASDDVNAIPDYMRDNRRETEADSISACNSDTATVLH